MGDSETLEHRDSRVAAAEYEGEIGDDPAVFKSVIHHDRIAKIVGVAQVAEVTIKEAIESKCCYANAVTLAKNTNGGVDGLYVVGWPHIAIGVGRMAGAPSEKVEALKTAARRRRGYTGRE